MKLVAATAFYNTKVLGIKLDPKDEKFLDKNHVHKGARINIGTAENFADLGATEQEHVGTLLKRGLVVFDDKANAENGVIAKIDKEADAEHAAHKKASTPPPSMEELVARAVAKALLEAGLIKPKAA